jgi:hypothetical protein
MLNLAIYVVIFSLKFFPHDTFKGPKQDPIIESQKIKIKIKIFNLY